MAPTGLEGRRIERMQKVQIEWMLKVRSRGADHCCIPVVKSTEV
jgi:hypothetical protein